MNIKRAKQEIKDAVQAYLMKDEYGEYQIPAIHQRPILLMGPPELEKHRSWSRFQGNVRLDWLRIRSRTIPDRVRSGFRLFRQRSTVEKSIR